MIVGYEINNKRYLSLDGKVLDESAQEVAITGIELIAQAGKLFTSEEEGMEWLKGVYVYMGYIDHTRQATVVSKKLSDLGESALYFETREEALAHTESDIKKFLAFKTKLDELGKEEGVGIESVYLSTENNTIHF